MRHTGDRATDHYHRYREDVALMKETGLRAYRFSVSWSRVIPEESGPPNAKGLDFYDRLVDALLAAGVQPWMTLFHWDLPQWAEDSFRGWESKRCAHAFAEYAAVVCKRLADRVAGVITINEFACFLDKGLHGKRRGLRARKGCDAQGPEPGARALLGHGLAAQAVRASSRKPSPG